MVNSELLIAAKKMLLHFRGTHVFNTIHIFMILAFPCFKLSDVKNHISICYLFIDIVHEVILMWVSRKTNSQQCLSSVQIVVKNGNKGGAELS